MGNTSKLSVTVTLPESQTVISCMHHILALWFEHQYCLCTSKADWPMVFPCLLIVQCMLLEDGFEKIMSIQFPKTAMVLVSVLDILEIFVIVVLHVKLLFLEKMPSFVFTIERALLVYHHSLYSSECNYLHVLVFPVCFK